MRAVNLIPGDSRRTGPGRPGGTVGPVHALIGLLAVAVLFMTIYVLSGNTISERKAKLASLQAEVTQANAQAARLTNYATFASLAQARAETVREIAASRFDWKDALSDLAKVVPADTSLQSLLGTAATGASAGAASGGSGASTGALRSAVAAPAFEIRGCTGTQDDVARLMSRLRLINGVTRVTLADSQKSDTAQGATASSSAASTSAAAGAAKTGCKPNTPTFDLVIFFKPLPSAGPDGLAAPGSVPASGAAGSAAAATPAAGAAPAAGTTTATTTATTTPAATAATPAAARPVSTTTPGGG